MKWMAEISRVIAAVVFLSAVGWTSHVDAQFGVGTWLRTDAQGKGLTMTVEPCCSGGFRLVYHVPAVGGQPPVVMTVDSPMDGTEVQTLIGGQPFGTSIGTISADGKTLTVESTMQVGGNSQKIIETWVRQ